MDKSDNNSFFEIGSGTVVDAAKFSFLVCWGAEMALSEESYMSPNAMALCSQIFDVENSRAQ